jgi:peptide/nickel transport system ATP-binding protein
LSSASLNPAPFNKVATTGEAATTGEKVPALALQSLSVDFATRQGTVNAVRALDLQVGRGQVLGVVGESGSGKSVSVYAVMQLLEANGLITGGSVTFDGIDLLSLNKKDMQDIRGREIAMIFQNPRSALNPIRKVGRQIEDVLVAHQRTTRADAKSAAIEALAQVDIRDAASRYHAYPFELSGGMCQRVGIALALACEPRLLIADEPTTGLDITTQNSVMELMMTLVKQRQMSAILITHDLALASAYCDDVVVMQHGKRVESGPPSTIFYRPAKSYTRTLVNATPHQGKSVRDLLPADELNPSDEYRPAVEKNAPGKTILSVENLCRTFDSASGSVTAVDNLSFELRQGECLGLVGESGSGKSTTAAMIARLLDTTSGRIALLSTDGTSTDIGSISAAEFIRHPQRARIQMVFQDAGDSIDPRHTARQAIEQPLRGLTRMRRAERRQRVESLAALTGLPPHLLNRFPHQLSGGQRARVNIARAVAVSPDVLILDEPTAALDVSIQAIVLNLLADLQAELGLSYLFISHDLYVVRMLCDRVMVMCNGQVVESGETGQVMTSPQHEYTRQLLSAMPELPVPDTLVADTFG